MDNTIYLQNLAAFNKVLNEKGFMSQSATYMSESLCWNCIMTDAEIQAEIQDLLSWDTVELLKPAPPSA